MDRDGNITSGGCVVYDELENIVYGGLSAEGQYIVDNDCSVTGYIELFGGAATYTIQRANINNSRDVVRGVHRNDFFNETSLFTMFRVD